MKSLNSVSAVILAGGLARRMGGEDKGLQCYQNKPLYQWVVEKLRPQISQISINANRNLAQYAHSGLPVFTDHLAGFQGPLSGILTALESSKTEWVLFVPCDSPFFPSNLLNKLSQAVCLQNQADKNFPHYHRNLIAYAADEEREHPTFCLVSCQLKEQLRQYLNLGQRKMLQFMHQNGAVKVVFSPQEGKFVNFNSQQDLTRQD